MSYWDLTPAGRKRMRSHLKAFAPGGTHPPSRDACAASYQYNNCNELAELIGWRRAHALASMRACVGLLSFMAVVEASGGAMLALRSWYDSKFEDPDEPFWTEARGYKWP